MMPTHILTANIKRIAKRYGWLICVVMVLLYGCSQVIDLKTEEVGGQLVIYGHISNGSVGNTVTVHRTADLGGPPVPVIDAQVNITDADGIGETLSHLPSRPGTYELAGDVLVREPGRQYALEVIVGDKFYRTELKEMPRDVGEDQLSFDVTTVTDVSPDGVEIREDVINVFTSTEFENLPESFYLRWEIEEAYTYLGTWLPASHFPPSGGQVQCYVINELNNQTIFLHDGETNRANVLPPQLLVSRRIDKSFQALHYFNVIKSSLTKESYEYWEKLQGIANRQGSIFDTPVAPVPGNIFADGGDETVLGFFDVVALDTTRLPITQNDVPIFFFDNCIKLRDDFLELFTVPRGCIQCLVDEGIVDPECLFCNVLPGSTSVRPSYF